MTRLSRLLTEANDHLGLATREIERRASAAGHPVGHATAANYLNGKHPKVPSEAVLQAFSAVFEIPMSTLREAAGLPSEVTELRLPAEAARLTPRQWEAVREIILSMVNPEGRRPQTRRSVGPSGDGMAAGTARLRSLVDAGAFEPRSLVDPEPLAAHEERHSIEDEQDEPSDP